jgi:nucleoside phosphorylase
VRIVNPVAHTLVCFALKEEAGAFRKHAAGRKNVSILLTGIGRKNAEKSVREFLKDNSLHHVFTCGFAGALSPELETGDVIFFTADASMAQRLASAGTTPAKFHCAARIATTADEKTELRRTTGADAVEMESETIQMVCRERGIPCATVRAISDAAWEDLPLDFNQLAKADQNLDYTKLAWAIAKSPRKISALMRLRKHTRFAAEELGKILAKVV